MPLKHAICLALFACSTPAWAGPVTLTSADGLAMPAVDWGRGEVGVLLVHGEGRSSQDWASLGPRLEANGFHALALNLRPGTDGTALSADVATAVAWLTEQGATSVHLVGAELGANIALSVAGDLPSVNGVVLLSPQLTAAGFKLSAATAAYGARPLLIVASTGDTRSARAAGYLNAHATGPHHLELLPGAAAGARLLNASPQVEPLIVSWLHGTFLQASDPDAAAQSAVKAGTIKQLETTGTRLQDRQR